MSVTATEVRSRGQWDIEDVPDTLLNTTAFIPAGNAWIETKLADIGKTFAGLSGDELVLATAAEIAAVAAIVAARAARGEMKTGLLAVKDINVKEMLAFADELRNEARDYLAMLGIVSEGGFVFDSAGGDDYASSGEDRTQIDIGQAMNADIPFSLWP